MGRNLGIKGAGFYSEAATLLFGLAVPVQACKCQKPSLRHLYCRRHASSAQDTSLTWNASIAFRLEKELKRPAWAFRKPGPRCPDGTPGGTGTRAFQSAPIQCLSGHCVSEIACLCCWMLRLLQLLALTVILCLLSRDVAGMM